jgi:hypothetical protein
MILTFASLSDNGYIFLTEDYFKRNSEHVILETPREELDALELTQPMERLK